MLAHEHPAAAAPAATIDVSSVGLLAAIGLAASLSRAYLCLAMLFMLMLHEWRNVRKSPEMNVRGPLLACAGNELRQLLWGMGARYGAEMFRPQSL